MRAGAPARVVAALVIALAAITSTANLAVESLLFEFERYNGTYSGLATEVRPIRRGPLLIRLSSPRHDLVVLANRLQLEPAGGGLHRARLWGRFSGDGDLEAEVELGPFPARFEDRVRVVEQEREIEALVRLEDHATGYLVVLEELPESLSVEIESDLAGNLVSFCTRVSRFVFGDAGCDALDHLLSNPELPLPEPGSRFVVRRDLLTAEELSRLERYLAASR